MKLPPSYNTNDVNTGFAQIVLTDKGSPQGRTFEYFISSVTISQTFLPSKNIKGNF